MDIGSISIETLKDLGEQARHIIYDVPIFRVQNIGITINHLMVASMSVVISLVVSKWVRYWLKKRFLARADIDAGIEFAVLRTAHYVIIFIGVYIGLSTLSIPVGTLVGVFAVLGVGIGFGLQNLASNFVSGVILLFERPVKVGDRITVDEVWGNVVQINLRTTVVNTTDNVSIIMPNSKLLENNLINWSYGDTRIRIRIPVGVAYGSDVEKVTATLLEAADAVELVLPDPPPEAWFAKFGDSSLDFQLVSWIERPEHKEKAVDQLNRQVDKLFRRDGIEIPFPQRVVHTRQHLQKTDESPAP